MKLTRKWFTLVEMLIVIVIIGILAAALIPRLTGIQSRARDTARKADLQQVGTALSTYKLDNNAYMTGSAAAWTWWDATAGIASLVTDGYLQSAPKDPSAWKTYQYTANTARSVFALSAFSEWGKQNANWTGTSTAPQALPSFASVISPSSVTLCNGITQNATAGNCQGNAGEHTWYAIVN